MSTVPNGWLFSTDLMIFYEYFNLNTDLKSIKASLLLNKIKYIMYEMLTQFKKERQTF